MSYFDLDPLDLLLISPKMKVWVNVSNELNIFTGTGVLWIVDLKNGIAKKPKWLNERNLAAPYPEYRTPLKKIEEFVLWLFRSNGYDIILDLRKKKQGLVKFNLPLTDRFKITR